MFQERCNSRVPEQGSGAEQIASLAAGPQGWSSLPEEIRGSKNLIAIRTEHSTCFYQRFLTRAKKSKSASTNGKLQEQRTDNPVNVMQAALLTARVTLVRKGRAEALSRACFTPQRLPD